MTRDVQPAGRERKGGGRGVWSGSGASAGIARGPGVVILSEGDLAHSREGDVIVVRHATAAMLPAVLRAAGVVCERGGVLNHLAVLARELGKPCVTGVPGIVEAIGPGALIRVDGTRGIVEAEESRVAEPPVEGEDELVAVMQFGLFGAAFEPLGQRAGVATALSVAALASVPAAFGLGSALTVEIRDGRVLVGRDRLRETVATLADRVEGGVIDASELRARFERLVSPGDGAALEADLGRYAEAYQLVWAASLVREPLAARYRAFLLGRLGTVDADERERLYLGSLILPNASYILRGALDGVETVWGTERGEAALPEAQARAEGARARERLATLLPPADRELAWRYLAALADLVDLTERKNTDLHRCARALFANSAREAAVAALLGLPADLATGDERVLSPAVEALAARLAQNRISTIPDGPKPG